MGEQAVVLKYVANALSQGGSRLVIYFFPPDPYFTGGGLNEPVDHFKEGGFAAAAGSQEYDRFSLFYVKGDIVDCCESAESFGDIFYLDSPIHYPAS
jgi:hypothetical protein